VLALAGQFVPFAVNVAASEAAEAVQPYLPLAERLGALLAGLCEAVPPVLEVGYLGQLADYDTERGISYWTKNYRTSIESTDAQSYGEALSRQYEYYDPIHTLPAEGQAWWAEHGQLDLADLKAAEMAEASRRTAALQAY